jgi:hypothetical protein
MGAFGGERYSSYLFLTLALDGVNGQRHALAALYPLGKDPRFPLDRRLGGPQSQDAGARRKILYPCRGLNPDRPAHVRHYTAWATAAL